MVLSAGASLSTQVNIPGRCLWPNLNLPLAMVTNVKGIFRPAAVAFIFSELGIQMSTDYDVLETVTGTRLSVVANSAANLMAQLSELHELRERVRKAQLSARRSRRTNGRKRKRI
jgi:hypothetical protein